MVKIPIRYVRFGCAGSDVDPNAVWNELEIYRNGINIALGILPTQSHSMSASPSRLTNGVISNTENVFVWAGTDPRYVQIDLGQIYTDLESIKSYHLAGRTFSFQTIEVSTDAINYTVLFDSEINGRYVDTNEGKTQDIPIDPSVSNEIKDVKFGSTQVNKIYCGTDLVFEKIIDTTAPITTPRPLDLVNNPTNTYSEPQTVWLDVNEMCDTYYTLDGGEPTTASAKYVGDGIYLDVTKVLKYFSIDQAGNAEAVKTTTYNINAVEVPISYISPSEVVQNNIPITVNITRSILEATTYYKIGTGAQQTFTAPFEVTQSMAGVQSTQIPITYWTVSNAGGTEAQRTLTYNTAGAIAGKAVVTATAGNNYVSVDWAAVPNATSYNVYRSTAAGTLGTLVSEYFTGLHYDDNWAINGTTYYYTVRAANYGGVGAVSDQAVATPNAAPSGWRYLKIIGYGSVEEPTTTRMIEVEAWEGATNRMAAATILSNEAISTGGLIGTIKDGIKTTSGYPIWWTATPNANVVVDLGASRALTSLAYYSYSTAGVPRKNRFKIQGSNTNNGADWVDLWDASANVTVQPALPSGYERAL